MTASSGPRRQLPSGWWIVPMFGLGVVFWALVLWYVISAVMA